MLLRYGILGKINLSSNGRHLYHISYLAKHKRFFASRLELESVRHDIFAYTLFCSIVVEPYGIWVRYMYYNALLEHCGIWEWFFQYIFLQAHFCILEHFCNDISPLVSFRTFYHNGNLVCIPPGM